MTKRGKGSDRYCIVTSKKADKLKGNVIWVISGEGKPKDYCLEYFVLSQMNSCFHPALILSSLSSGSNP